MSAEDARIPGDAVMKQALVDWQKSIRVINDELGDMSGSGEYYEELLARRAFFQGRIDQYSSVLNGASREPGDTT